MEPTVTPDTSIASLLKGIVADLRMLMREELSLARVELTVQATRAKTAAVSVGIAVAALAAGAIFLLIAIALGIADALLWPVWAGFLFVAIALAVIGLIAYAVARRRLNAVQIVPTETVTTLKENSAWIAKRLSSEPR
jgi:drug/metabolite transporter (DMT)-like permease